MKSETKALAVLTLIGIAGGVAVAVGVLAQPLADWRNPDSVFTAAGRVTGMLAGFMALLMVVFMARIPILEKAFGQDQLTAIHRKLGPYTLYLMLAHVVFITTGYSRLTDSNAWTELWRLVFEVEKMLPALIGFILFFVVGITSYRRFRNRLKYESWWQIHFLTYLAIGLSFFHQVETGVMFRDNQALKFWWISYYLLAFGFIFYFKWLSPYLLSRKLNLTLAEIIQESPTTNSLIFQGTNLSRLNASGGQYLNFHIPGLSKPGISHPFSLSRSPQPENIRVTVKSLGDFTAKLANLTVGQRVNISGPYGTFTAELAISNQVVLIAGGVGITPIRAVLEELPAVKNVVLIWRAHSVDELPLESEILELASIRGFQVHKLIGPRTDFDLSANGLLALAPEIQSADVFVCGPAGLVALVQTSTKNLGIKPERFHAESFEY